MRKKVGVSVVTTRKDEKDKFNKVGKALEENKIAAVREMTVKFKASLTEFASKHKDRINSDPEFRQQFHKMCVSVGVDPLASNKGFWADILGVGDFYFELGVKIIQISLSTRTANGGIMSLTELMQRLNNNISSPKRRKSTEQSISEDDIIRGIEKISVLGNGYRLLRIGGKKIVVSIPLEISSEAESLMTIAQQNQGMISFPLLSSQYNWSSERFTLAVNPLLAEGIVWIDRYEGYLAYFFPSIWKECLLEEFHDESIPAGDSSSLKFVGSEKLR